MANDREFSVILKATDLSTQPIQQVLEAVKRLTEAQKQNNEAAAQGSITAKEFGDGLKTLLAGAQGLTGAQTGLQRFLDQQKLVAERLDAVAAAQAKLDAKRAEVAPGAEPSDKQAAAIQRLEKALASAQGRSDSANSSLETLRTSLDKMGVAADLSDKRAAQLGNAREKALQAVLAAQEKLDAKIASSPAEGERTKAQEYSIRRLADALTNAQTKAEQAGAALASYQNVKLNEAVVQAQVKLREGIEATIPVVQRANVETLSLTENRNKAAAAAAAQAEIEKRTAAEIEAASREAITARDVQNRQAIAAEDERINALVGAAARQKELYDADQRARQENYDRELVQAKEQEAAESRLAKKREADAKEQQKFQQASYVQLFTPALDQADAEEKNRIERDKAAKQEQIEAEKALAAARVAESHRAVEAEDARIAALVGARDRVFTITEEERAAREKAYNEEQAAVARLTAAQKKAAEDEVKFRRDQKQAQYENLFTPVHEADLEAVKRQKAAEDDLAKARAKAALEQEARLEALRESQGKIGDAIARTPGTQPLGVSAEPPANFSNLSAQLQAIIAPAEAARQTIGGVAKQIEELGAVLEGPKLRTQDYDKALRSLVATLNGVQRLGGLVDSYYAQEAATTKLGAALDKEKSTRDAMTTLYARTKVYDEQQVVNINRQIALVAKLSTEFNRENESLAGLRSGLEAAGINFQSFDRDIQRLTDTAAKGKVVFDGLKIKAGKEGDELNFLGLRPYELQNLSYQINDVFTQLGSGTPITQVFAQQSGQIFQLFQRQLGAALTSLKEMPFALTGIGVAVAAATVGILAFVRAIDVAGERRRFASDLAQNVDGARYNIEQLVASAKGLQQFGVSIDEAADGIRALINAGASREKLIPLLELSAHFANANNLKFPEALKQVSAAFTGTGAELLKFTTEMNHLLDINQFRNIRDAIEDGRIVEARALAMEAVFGRMRDAADKNTSSITKAFRDFKTAYTEFLDALGNNRVVNAFGTDLVKFLGEALNLARDLFNLMDSIAHLDLANARRAIEGKDVIREQGIAPAGQQGASTPGQKPGETEDFVRQRDAAADLAGVAREAFRILQQSEGVWDAKLNKWVDVMNGGQGPAQVLRSTFDELKRRYPEQIKGDVHDVQSNLNAGALYLREMAEKANNSFGKAVEGYKQGPGFAFGSPQERLAAASSIPMDRFHQNARSTQQIGSLYPGQVVLGPIGGPAQPQVSTNAQQIATDEFRKNEADRRRASEEAYADEQRRYRLFVDDLQQAEKEVNSRAQAEAAKHGAPTVDQVQLDKDVAAARLEVWRKYEEARSQRAAETQRKLDEIDQQALQGDRTNADARIKISNQQFDARRRELEIENQRGRFPTGGETDEFGQRAGAGGKTFQQALDELDKSRNQANANIVIDAAKAIVDNAVKERDARLREIQAQLDRPGANVPELLARQAETVRRFAPVVERAVNDSNKALDRANRLQGGEETEAVRATRAQNEAIRQRAQRPEIIGQSVQQGTGIVQGAETSAIEQGKAQIGVIADSVKVAGTSATDAINHITEVGKQWITGLRDTTRTTNDALRSIAVNASPQERDKLKTDIARNELAPLQAAVDVQNAILATVNETKQRLDKLLEEYNRAMEDIDKRLLDHRIDALTAATERAGVRARLLPGITAAGQDVQRAVGAGQQAAGTLGLNPTFKADLAAVGQAAATQSSAQSLTSQDFKKQADDLRLLARETQSTATETARTQADLLRLHATTQTAAEAAVKDAFAQANAELDKQAPAIEKLIHDMEAVGNIQGAKKLAADWALVRAQMQYIDPLTQQIIQGFEQSFVSHATQAFDTIAKSIADVAVHGGKLKDVWSAVGQGFASMAAGILSDIAKIIIKYELLKLINDALGTNIPTGASGSGSSGGGGGSSTGGILQGILKVAGIAASAWAGSAGGVSDSGAFVGSGGGAATAADADALSSFANDAAGAGYTSEEYAQALADGGATKESINALAGHNFFHAGGTVGTPGGMSKVVDLSVFREAQRYHSGGPVLASDEVPIIAQRGEKIVSLAQQRQEQAAASAQANGTGGTSIRNVLAVGDKEIASAMNTPHGEKVVLNILQRNAPTVKKFVG